MIPTVGLTQYKAARVPGNTRDPSVSVPIETVASPAATPTADPDEDPPGFCASQRELNGMVDIDLQNDY